MLASITTLFRNPSPRHAEPGPRAKPIGRRRWWAAARATGAVGLPVLAVMVSLAYPADQRAHASSVKPTIGVVDFYAPTPLSSSGSVVPELFAADDLSAMLDSGSEGRFVVVSRDNVRHAEAALKWTRADALNFARLGDLAQSLHVDRLVVGQITRLVLNPEAGPGNTRTFSGDGTIVVQVFDAHARRMTWRGTESGHGRSTVVDRAAQNVLRDAVKRAVGPLTTTLATSK